MLSDKNYSENELKELFDSLHDVSKLKTKRNFDKSFDDFYNYSILRAELNVKLNLGRLFVSHKLERREGGLMNSVSSCCRLIAQQKVSPPRNRNTQLNYCD